MNKESYSTGSVEMRGCFTGEFGLGDELPIDEAPYVIERDRINEGKLPGFNRKLLPMMADADGSNRTAGGYYLLETFEQAKYMYEWYQDPVDGFVLDGIPMMQRKYFLNPVAHFWQVIGAHDFKSIDTRQKIVRFQRWTCEQGDIESKLVALWPSIRDQAESAGLSSTWLLMNPEQEESIGLVMAADASANYDGSAPDFAAVESLSRVTSPGQCLEDKNWARLNFDRSSLIYSIWFPYATGANNRPTLWPNSPPFPGL